MSVHPRARGEQNAAAAPAAVVSGSSPRTRGTVGHRSVEAVAIRFIPAHAGNRRVWPPAPGSAPVHPRARGEQMSFAGPAARFPGSSPRTRGTVPKALRQAWPPRFIPAHAGNSFLGCTVFRLGAVHPRARGEQAVVVAICSTVGGSSPRTRGTGRARAGARPRARFIPAHAGNRRPIAPPPPPPPVHPRARGEQSLKSGKTSISSGSSPRTRGTVTHGVSANVHRRFIPAHAGNRVGRQLGAGRVPVHPRARGEQLRRPVPPGAHAGSSPRTRGTGVGAADGHRERRFIPAHAGNRKSSRPTPASATVHPRARGEQVVGALEFDAHDGSSPRTRGTDFI